MYVCITAWDGGRNVDIFELQDNLVPYPRIHFTLSCYVVIIAKEKPTTDSSPWQRSLALAAALVV